MSRIRLLSPFFEWKYRSRSWRTTFAVAPFDGKYLTSYLMTIVMFAVFQCLHVKIATATVWSWKFRYDLCKTHRQTHWNWQVHSYRRNIADLPKMLPLTWMLSLESKIKQELVKVSSNAGYIRFFPKKINSQATFQSEAHEITRPHKNNQKHAGTHASAYVHAHKHRYLDRLKLLANSHSS